MRPQQVNGADLRPLPLDERKATSPHLSRRSPPGFCSSEHIEEDGATVFRHACRLGCEDIVSKRRDAPYRSGWVRTWIKVKNQASPATTRVWELKRRVGRPNKAKGRPEAAPLMTMVLA